MGLDYCFTVVVFLVVFAWFQFQNRRLARRMQSIELQLSLLRARPKEEEATVLLPANPPTVPESAEAVAPSPATPPRAPTPPVRAARGLDWETWIGQRGLGWVAVFLLLMATGFFLQQAFEHRWIGELARITLGAIAGAALCVAGYWYHCRGYRLFSQMLTSSGAVLLYLVTFATFGFYHLMPQSSGGIFLVLIVLEIASLSLLYDAPALAIMAVIGGLITPPLLSTGQDRYAALFTYLTVLDLGAITLVVLRGWPALATIALAGTEILFAGWYNQFYHPTKLGVALSFQCLIFVLFLLPGLIGPLARRRPANIEDLVRLTLNAFCFSAAGYMLLDEDYHLWMGSLALVLASVHLALGLVVTGPRVRDGRQGLVYLAIAMGLVAVVFPLQARGTWAPLGWAVQGALLWGFGLRVRLEALRGLGAVFLAASFVGLMAAGNTVKRDETFVPVLNRDTLPALGVAACWLVLAGLGRNYLRSTDRRARIALAVVGLAGVALVWFLLTRDVYDYVLFINPSAARMCMSFVWAVYAALLLTIGMWKHITSLRWTALGLFGLTLGKVVLVDMSGLPGLYRAGAFLALAVTMAFAARIYQRARPARPAEVSRE